MAVVYMLLDSSGADLRNNGTVTAGSYCVKTWHGCSWYEAVTVTSRSGLPRYSVGHVKALHSVATYIRLAGSSNHW